MHGVGVREWVALGVLAFGLVLGALFFNPLSTNGSGDGNGPSPVQLAPTFTPTVEPTATPVPPTVLDEPKGSWFVRWFETTSTGGEIRVGQGFVDSVALDVPGRPFPDTPADGWRREASRSLA